MPEGIDFVVTWVDGADENWRQAKADYLAESEYGDQRERYRDWDLLRYWFRGVEKFAPWVRKIHFVTWGHIPEWIAEDHPKLHIVCHEEFLPESMLPTFNSSILELYVHRIPELAERFVLFNDDMFLLGNVGENFFFRNGKPCDMLALQPVIANPANPNMSHVYLNNALVLSRHFEKRECAKRNPGHFFHPGYPALYFWYNLLEMGYPQLSGLYTVHGPAPFLKSTFQEIWEREGGYLEALSGNRFRADTDVNQYLFREWQKLSGNFVPKNVCRGFRYFEITDDNSKLCRMIAGGKCRIICVNDTDRVRDADAAKRNLQGAFEKLLPDKCSFEE